MNNPVDFQAPNLGAASLTPIGYPQLRLGLNNQKMALLGLVADAHRTGRPMTLPQFVAFDITHRNHRDIPFADVFEQPLFEQFLTAFGIDFVRTGPAAETTDGWASFQSGAHEIGRTAIKGACVLDGLVCQFFANLRPLILQSPVFQKLEHAVFNERAVTIVGQFRIETDWIEAAKSIRRKEPYARDEFALDYQQIIAKTLVTLPEVRTIYVVCDEAHLPEPKEHMRAEAARLFGVNLIWKSDILSAEELQSLSVLHLSLIDFEMAIRAPTFVGMTRSTFSNLVSYETLCRRGTRASGHYIYNYPGSAIVNRLDAGAHVDVFAATNRLLLRAPLIAPTEHDCLWPAALIVHISNHGDFESRNAIIPGTRTSHLVCGVRGDPLLHIEGFSIAFDNTEHGALEYRACLANDGWTDWVGDGAFVGTIGARQSLHGFSVRLTGQLALRYDCMCVGAFAGVENLIIVSGGAPCAAFGEKLEAMQIIFRPMVNI